MTIQLKHPQLHELDRFTGNGGQTNFYQNLTIPNHEARSWASLSR